MTIGFNVIVLTVVATIKGKPSQRPSNPVQSKAEIKEKGFYSYELNLIQK